MTGEFSLLDYTWIGTAIVTGTSFPGHALLLGSEHIVRQAISSCIMKVLRLHHYLVKVLL